MSGDALSALQEFYKEQEVRKEKQRQAEELAADPDQVTWDEDWQLSQFSYDDNTANALAEEGFRVAEPGGSIACVSTPTLYITLRTKFKGKANLKLFEFDQRFTLYGEDFELYNYKSPLAMARELREKFDIENHRADFEVDGKQVELMYYYYYKEELDLWDTAGQEDLKIWRIFIISRG